MSSIINFIYTLLNTIHADKPKTQDFNISVNYYIDFGFCFITKWNYKTNGIIYIIKKFKINYITKYLN